MVTAGVSISRRSFAAGIWKTYEPRRAGTWHPAAAADQRDADLIKFLQFGEIFLAESTSSLRANDDPAQTSYYTGLGKAIARPPRANTQRKYYSKAGTACVSLGNPSSYMGINRSGYYLLYIVCQYAARIVHISKSKTDGRCKIQSNNMTP